MAITRRKYNIDTAAVKMERAVSAIEVGPAEDLRGKLEAQGIRMVTPMHDINDDSYVPGSALEKKLEEVYGRGANDSDDVCTIELDGFQTLLFEHAGQYMTSNNVLDVKSGELKTLSPQVENLLVGEMTVGTDVLDRSYFYQLTKDMTQEQLDALRARVAERVEDFNRRVHEEEAKREGLSMADMPLLAYEKERKGMEKELNSWFRPWTRLAGRIEFAMESREMDSGKNLDEAMLSSIVGEFARMEEYAPYLERELKGFAFNRCVDRKLDYTKLPPELKTADLEKKFLEEFPFCVEAKEWDMLSMAYNMGTKAVIRLQEEESLENGYIGGEVRFSRYTPVIGGPVIPGGKVTGIGQIDYKDCTNAFAIIDSNRKAVAWFDMSEYQRRSTLECVELSRKFREAQGQANARGRRKGVNI